MYTWIVQSGLADTLEIPQSAVTFINAYQTAHVAEAELLNFRSVIADPISNIKPATASLLSLQAIPEDFQTIYRTHLGAMPENSQSSQNANQPPSWEELADGNGRTYYANHHTRTNTWQRPEAEAAGLPVAWQALVDDEGRTYYVNHASKTTTFTKPENPAGQLPEGWEVLHTAEGVAYLADHNNHTTTWNDPRSSR